MYNSGHGGSRTAEYLKNNLFKNLSSHPDFIKDTKSAIGINILENYVPLCLLLSVYSYITGLMIWTAVESFRRTDADYLNEEKTQQKDAGSTASAAVLVGDRLLVANVGDSRVVASRAGTGYSCRYLYFCNMSSCYRDITFHKLHPESEVVTLLCH